MFRKSLMLCAASLMFVGCGQMEGDEFREGLPSKQVVNVKEPGGSAGQGLESAVTAFEAKLGARSDFYTLTRGATVSVNGGTAFGLNLVDEVTQHTPTSINGDVAVWGPYEGTGLDPTTWKLSVTRLEENSYSYKLEGKANRAADTDFKVILSGTHNISLDAQGNRQRDFGSGTMTIDWDAAQALPEHGNDIGTATIRYSRVSADAVASVEADFRNVKDDDRPGTKINVDYRYKETPGAGGEFDFAVNKNFDADTEPTRTAIEHLTIKSRWLQNGSGRADVKITGGDFSIAAATVSECWDANFSSQFLEASWVTVPLYGNLSACGSFNTAVYSGL